MIVKSACSLPGEQFQLHAALSNFSYIGPRAGYASWLRKQGDTDRSQAVIQTIEGFQTLDETCLENLAGSEDWLRMIGAPLLSVFISQTEGVDAAQRLKFRNQLFAKIRPAVSMTYAPLQDEPPIGSSHLWGQPDMAPGEKWPTIADASNFFNARDDLPQDHPCAFVGQFAFRDFAQTILGQTLPKDGGFSVFAFTEVETLGIVEALVRPWNPSDELQRRAPPSALIEDVHGDGVNRPEPAYSMTLTDVISIPDATSKPYSSVIEHCEWEQPFSDMYPGLKDACTDSFHGFGGYLSGTSGDDPSPDTGSLRLAVLRTNPDVGVIHFSIPNADLAIGRLDRAQNVWIDWDS